MKHTEECLAGEVCHCTMTVKDMEEVDKFAKQIINERKIKTLKMIAEDMRKDAEHYEGQAFNGGNVSEYFGKHGAAIAALANITASIIMEQNEKEE